MNRREFLSTAVLSTTLALRAAAASRRIPIGFLGATYSHGPEIVKLAMSSRDWEFVGVCDSTDSGRAGCARCRHSTGSTPARNS